MINRAELLESYAENHVIHRRLFDAEWNRQNTTGLTYSQKSILILLNREGPKQSKHFVTELSITSGGITGITDKLLKEGYIQRSYDVTRDRRAVVYEITESGRSILKELEMVYEKVLTTVFAAISDAEVAMLEHIYRKLTVN
ncbi:MAG: MarR family transcriptional regulator [Candidatus Cohnella colombiensis]|uniref:MarR family transcriptional regulator n=1 Tax=Candidatus Cohnella colombiensis TaxID=3121368 RepID=A0AA95JDM2_9BACL|nr:MAG: MarR family transcriptional regulator [Cohnella sp.]